MSRFLVAVHCFENLGDPGAGDYFARGFTEDLMVEIDRFPSLAVRREADRKDGADEDYVLTGTIRRSGDRIRINARLTHGSGGAQIWAERFESRNEDPMCVQDEIACAVAGALASKIDQVRLDQARRVPITSLAAYDCWLRGRDCLLEGSADADAEARLYFERALELDPHYPRALAGLSLAHYNDWSCQSWHLWSEGETLACEHAEKAVSLDDGDAMVHVILGRVRLYERKFAAAEQCLSRALSLNPNDPEVLAHVALWTVYLGEPEQGIRLVERSMQLNPEFGPWLYASRGLARYLLEDYQAAYEDLIRAGDPFVDTAAFRAAAAQRIGDREQAETGLRDFLASYILKINFGRAPDVGEPISWLKVVNPFRRAADLERVMSALRALGLEDSRSGAAERTSEARPPELPGSASEFRRDGDVWTVTFGGTGARLTGVKGFHDLSVLLREPGRPVHCLELAGAPPEEAAAPVLDPAAKRAYEERIRELRTDLAEAEARHDEGRAARARAELEQVTDELGRAFGLGGRSRKLGHPSERARSAATWRIRSAIKKIRAAHPRLGLHLTNSIRTGTCCVYEPEEAFSWLL